MKRVVKKIIECVVMILAIVYPPQIHYRIQQFLNFAYSVWIKRVFAKVGRNPHFTRPMHLIGTKYITIGDNFHCGFRTRIEAWDYYEGEKFYPQIMIGNNVSMNLDCHIGAIDRIEIKDNVLIGSRVLITDHNHGNTTIEDIKLFPSKRPLRSNGPVIIEKNVWIGEGVAILSGVTIGENSIVAANSVVTKSFPKNCVIGGIPAKVIKKN